MKLDGENFVALGQIMHMFPTPDPWSELVQNFFTSFAVSLPDALL